MFDSLISKAIDELVAIADDVTTSDLQGIVDVRSAEIGGTKLYTPLAMEISERILSGIYNRRESLP